MMKNLLFLGVFLSKSLFGFGERLNPSVELSS